LEIPKHLSTAGRQGIPLKKIGCISDEVYKGITDILLRDKIEIIKREDK
jgi:hypothetical protein